jgi:hypothetical protein
MVAYHCINGFLFPLIYGLTKIQELRWLCCFGKFVRWPFSRFSHGFWYFGVKFQSSLTSTIKDLTFQAIVGLKNVQLAMGKCWTFMTCFSRISHNWYHLFLISKDHDKKLDSFPFQHIWIWNSLLKLFGATFIFFLFLSSLTLIYDIEHA